MATTEPRMSVTELDSPQGLAYDGFISYSHAANDLLAPRLQAGLQRFAKPWWKRRALRIFRDESSLSAEVSLALGRTYNALAASDAFIATGHSDGRVMLWEAADFGTTDQPVAEWQLFDDLGGCAPPGDPTLDGIRRLRIMESTSGLQLRVVDQCGTATGWQIVADDPTSAATFANSLTVGFGPDDSYLLSQVGTRLRLLGDDGAEIRRFDAHREEILQTSTSRDLDTMASVSRDLIGLWYTRSGESLASGIAGAQAHIAGDGSFAVTSGGAAFDWFAGPVVVWDLDPDTWQEQTCESAGRNLSFFEWQQFFPKDPYRVTCPQWPSGARRVAEPYERRCSWALPALQVDHLVVRPASGLLDRLERPIARVTEAQ